jgi:serine/threonine protein kinase
VTDETIFATALEKFDPAERVAYLAEACAGDPEQRKRVEGLLAALEKAGGFLEKPAIAPPDPDAAPTRAFGSPDAARGDGATRTHRDDAERDTDDLSFLSLPQRPDSIGRIGHYEVLEVLGRGGFGIVFRAFDDVLQRVVAVKVLAPSLAATSPARKRFIREARAAGVIQHENVVRIHGTGEEPLPYLVMEFVSGETLQNRLDRIGPLDVLEVLRIGRQIAEGLAAAHEKGLIHRDIKPSNILIEGGSRELAKLTDFGLARAADDASVTRSGIVAGTPMYMAPEQARGEALDHRADLFSLGSVLYAMLTGRPPFRASGTMAVLKRVCEENPRPIREVIPEVPEWLCRIVEKLQAKDPAERFQSAKEVADLLERHLAHMQQPGIVPMPEPVATPSGSSSAPPSSVPFPWWVMPVLGPVVLYLVAHFFQPSVWAIVAFVVLFLSVTVLLAAVRGFLARHSPQAREPRPIPQPTIGRRRRLVIAALVLVFLVAGAVWAGPYALRAIGDRAEVELVSDPDVLGFEMFSGVTSDESDPQVDEGGSHSTIRCSPGAYRIEAKCKPGRAVGNWELTAHGLFTSQTQERAGESLLLSVSRGDSLTVRPILRDAPSPPSPDTDGWVQLFNGKDLSGWKTHKDQPGDWSVEGGVIVGRAPRSHLYTDRGDYENFHIRAEVRINDGGNSGLYFRSSFGPEFDVARLAPPGAPPGAATERKMRLPNGYEADISLDSTYSKTGSLWSLGPSAIAVPVKEATIKPDTWFTLEVIARGNRIVTKVDGRTVLDWVDGQKRHTKGHFALQVFHANTVVEFRKVEVKELPATSPEVPRRAADVLPFLAGTWKVEMLVVEPKLPPDKARAAGYFICDYVAGDKFLRERGAFEPGIVEPGDDVPLMLFFHDPAKDVLTHWAAWPDGTAYGPVLGKFDPDSRSLLWLKTFPGGSQYTNQSNFVDANTITTRLYDQDATGKIVLELHLTFTRMKGPVAVPDQTLDPKRPEEMKVLDLIVGEWRSEATVKDSTAPNKPKAETARMKTESILGGRFVEMSKTFEELNTNEYLLYWFDAAAKRYRSWLFSHSGYVIESTGAWDEAAKTLTWISSDGLLEGRWTFKNDALREFRHLVKDKDGKTLSETTGVARRTAPGFVSPFNGKEPLDPAVHLKDAVVARTRTRDDARLRLEEGKASKLDLLAAEVDLTEARIKLAEYEAKPTTVVALLETLVELRQEERTLIALRVEVGFDRPDALNQADARLADAKARLARVRPPDVAPQPRQAPKLLRRFDPARDETITRGAQDKTGWAFSSRGASTLRLYEISNPQVDADGVLVFRVKTRITDVERAYLAIICRYPDGSETSSAIPEFLKGSTNLAAYEVRCPLKPDARPNLIRLNLVFVGEKGGNAFFKEMELWQLPTEQLHGRLAAPTAVLRKFDPARDESVTYGGQDASGWSFAVKPGQDVVRLFELENPATEEAATLVLRGRFATTGVTRACFQIVCYFPDGTETASDVPEVVAEGDTNPTPYEVRHLLKKGAKPYLIRVNLALRKSDKDQSVFLKELELSQVSADPKK